MAYTTINKSTDYFNTKLYTGNGGSQAITGVGFQPDWCWFKNRDASGRHQLYDAVRGATKLINSDSSDGEQTVDYFTSFDSDGFTIGSSSSALNTNGEDIASFNWKAGTTSGITQGGASITPTAYSFNQTAGFSIIKYTGGGAAATVPHGLGVAPSMIIVKNLTSGVNWFVYHKSLGATKYIILNNTDAQGTATNAFNDTAPTSSVFSIGTNNSVAQSGNDFIAYCFAEKTGYSKFGTYTGNGNANGAFVYTGFKPAWVLIKVTSTANDWILLDNKRDSFNVATKKLLPNESNAESSDSGVSTDFLSNGFKIRTTGGNINQNSATFIYMAFGQTMVGSNNIPATAR